MSDTTAGWVSTSAGILRAFEDTNTSRESGFGARRGPVSSRAAWQLCHGDPEDPSPAAHAPGEAALAAAFFSCLYVRTFCSDTSSTTSATDRYPSRA